MQAAVLCFVEISLIFFFFFSSLLVWLLFLQKLTNFGMHKIDGKHSRNGSSMNCTDAWRIPKRKEIISVRWQFVLISWNEWEILGRKVEVSWKQSMRTSKGLKDLVYLHSRAMGGTSSLPTQYPRLSVVGKCVGSNLMTLLQK